MAVLLQNALIADGTGAPLKRGDILFDNGRILAVGACGNVPKDTEVIDCGGLIATPGFIDAHSHNDWFILNENKEMYLEPFIRQGITTFVAGNCGFSASGFDQDSAYMDEIGGGLFHLNPNAKEQASLDGFLDRLNGASPVNLATLAGHGTARISVNGKGAEPLTQDRFDRMMALLEQSLQQGALGISLGLMYEPGIFAPKDELLAVARLCKKYDRILTVHPKAMSTVSLSYPLLKGSHLLLAFKELEEIVRETGVRFEYSHLLFVGERTWKDEKETLRMFEQLQNDGFQVGFDMYPLNYGASVITVILPEWYMALPKEKRMSPFVKLKLGIMIKATIAMLGFDFSDITIAWAGEKNAEMTGKTIAELAELWQVSDLTAYLRVCEESDFKAEVLQGRYQNCDIVKRLMQSDFSLFMTDAWVTAQGKQNGGIYGAFPMFLELADEIGMPIEKAVAKMTGLTAKRFKLPDRGELRPGACADIVLLDRAKIKSRIDAALPPLGIEYVFVNGCPVLKKGEYQSGQTCGQAICVKQ